MSSKVRSFNVEELLGRDFELPAHSVVSSNAQKLTDADLDPDGYVYLSGDHRSSSSYGMSAFIGFILSAWLILGCGGSG